jgi:transposase
LAVVAGRVGRPLDRLRQWALQVQSRTCHNKAAVALANKLARIVWATWRHGEDFQCREPLGLAV